jgi:FKBP-type peptidyl-prolyl cis-trans isomerase SlyD
METKPNKYIAVSYKLYTIENGNKKLVEETTTEKPFQFISGLGTTIEGFENAVVELEKDGKFDFTLTKDNAYGDYVQERVLDLDKEIFSINGKFDSDNIYVDAIVPLQNEDGNRFNGHILAISDDKVKIDLNHPLAGKELNFVGSIVESREATNEEIERMVTILSGEGECGGCGCDDCGGCGSDKGEGGCEHHHGQEGGCGHCH